MSYRVIISQASRNNTREPLTVFNHDSKVFSTEHEAKDYIQLKYGKIKSRTKIFCDGKRGEPILVGYAFGSWKQDYNPDTGKTYKYYQQDWVEIKKETTIKW
jgi:hypothetical protein